MTNMPEAKLAREAEICYASVAMVTDFDCWHPDHDAVTVQDIIRVLNSNADKAKALVARLAADLPARARAVPDRFGPRARHRFDHRAGGARSRFGEEARRGGGPGAAIMKVDGRHFRSIWLEPDGWSVGAIDQRRLPHEFVVARIESVDAAAEAIRAMLVRGAPLIGATAAYGIALAMRADPSDAALDQACRMLIATRPTAVNLKWALDEMRRAVRPLPPAARAAAAYARAGEIAEQDVAINREIGRHGLALIEAISATRKSRRTGQHIDALQRRLAGDGRFRNGNRADLPGA